MTSSHLSKLEQEEYLLNQRTPKVLRHLAECSACRDQVADLQQLLSLFRSSAIAYSADSLSGRPQPVISMERRYRRAYPLRWALAALVLLALLLLPFHLFSPKAAAPAVGMSDDALLEQVDEQLSVAVPSPMESLTHLVSTDSSNAGTPARVSPSMRSQPSAQSN